MFDLSFNVLMLLLLAWSEPKDFAIRPAHILGYIRNAGVFTCPVDCVALGVSGWLVRWGRTRNIMVSM